MNEEAKLRQYEKMSLKLAASSFGSALTLLVLGKLLDTGWVTTLMLVIAINLAVIGVILVVYGVYYAYKRSKPQTLDFFPLFIG